MNKYVGAIDLGTTSNRFILFDKHGNIFASAQKGHEQIFPKSGLVEHDPMEIWKNIRNSDVRLNLARETP